MKARLAELEKTFPKGVSTALLIDQSRFIEVELSSVEHHIVIGAAMAILIILVFMMDLRSTLISAVALPTSVIGTFYAMYLLGFTLNMMTLLALSLAIGLLIDDAVVVRENIFKHIERGKPPMQAALDDAKVMIRFLNEEIARMIDAAPDRFIGLGCVPLQDIDAANKELHYIKEKLKFSGVEIASASRWPNIVEA